MVLLGWHGCEGEEGLERRYEVFHTREVSYAVCLYTDKF